MSARLAILFVAAMLALAAPAVAKDVAACRNEKAAAAIAACTRAIEGGKVKGRELALLYHARANALETKRDFERALADHSEAIRLDAGNVKFWTARCWVRVISGRQVQEAFGDCVEALRLKPDNDLAYDSLGLVNLRLGQFDQAISDFDAALKINPRLANSLYGRGLARLRKGDEAGGNADVAAAKAINPSIAEEYEIYGIK